MTTEQLQNEGGALLEVIKTNNADLDKEKAKSDKKIAAANKAYDEAVKPFKEAIADAEEALEKLSQKNKGAFAEVGHIATPFGVFGFKKTPPAVDCKDENKALKMLTALPKKLRELFTTTKTSINKNAVKSSLKNEDAASAKLTDAGFSLTTTTEFKYALDKQRL